MTIIEAVLTSDNLVEASKKLGRSKPYILRKLQESFPDKHPSVPWKHYLSVKALPDSKVRKENSYFWFAYFYLEKKYYTGLGDPGKDCEVYFRKQLPGLLAHSLEYYVWSFIPRNADGSLNIKDHVLTLELIEKYYGFFTNTTS